MKQFDATILENKELAENYYELFLTWPEDVRAPMPGQILSINVEKGFSPFLRRPFAFASYDRDQRSVSVIYHRRGPATEILAAKRAGETLDVLGPRGFYFQLGRERSPILVGGGIGTGPVVFAANWLVSKGLNPLLVLGYRHKELFPDLNLDPEVRLQVCTDDGSLGFHGNVVQYLESLSVKATTDAFVWACGPHPMLQAAHFFSKSRGIPCAVSIEEVMACGVGACLGCAVETTDSRKMVRVCTEGPVFSSEVIAWT